jgi:hypothetical protein
MTRQVAVEVEEFGSAGGNTPEKGEKEYILQARYKKSG